MKISCIIVIYLIVHFIPALANASYQLCCCEKLVVKSFKTQIQVLVAWVFGKIQLYFSYNWYKNYKLAREFRIAESEPYLQTLKF